MTNAGDTTWSVELRIDELLRVLDHTVVADISLPASEYDVRPTWAWQPPTFGIITGNGPESGMLLWRSINGFVRGTLPETSLGDSSMPRVLVHSLPEMGLSMELDTRHAAVWPALRAATGALCRDGASVIALACNTTPYFAGEIREICREYGSVFISMPEVVGAWLHERHIRHIALLAVKTVAGLGHWSPYRQPLAGITVEVPDATAMARIHELAYRVKAEGPSTEHLSRLRDLIRAVTDAHVVVLALTELSLVLELQKGPSRSDRVVVDAIDLYARALAARFVGDPSSKPGSLLATPSVSDARTS